MNHVLIVDDEAEIRESLEGILREEGYLVTTAATAAEALELLRDAAYDVVLLDIWLPDRDGLETLGEIRQFDSANIPEVVIISGHGTIEAAVRATKLGAYDFLEKPLSLDRTLIVLKNAMKARQRADEGSAPADQADGSDEWARAHLWRERDGQGVDWSRDACREPAEGSAICRAELRGYSGGLYRERAVRLSTWGFAGCDGRAGSSDGEAGDV